MVIKSLLWQAARRVAQNPEVQRKAAEVASSAWEKARPKVENAGRHVAETLRETADEVDVKKSPVTFAKAFRNRLLPDDTDR